MRTIFRLSTIQLLLILPVPAETVVVRHILSGTTPPGVAAGRPAGSYPLSGFENVNLFSGSLHFGLPLLNAGGRGTAGYTMTLPIEQRWRVEHIDHYFAAGEQIPPDLLCQSTNPCREIVPTDTSWAPFAVGYGPGHMFARRGSTGHGQSAACPAYPSHTLTRLTFTTPGGSEHEFHEKPASGTGGQPAFVQSATSTCAVNFTNRGKIFVTNDGSMMTFISDNDIFDELFGRDPSQISEVDYPTGYLFLKNGVRYRIVNGLVQWIRDPNGNTVRFFYEGTGSGPSFSRVTQIRDSLNRRINIAYGASADTITYTGFNGNGRTIVVNHASMGAADTCLANPEVMETGVSLKPIKNGENGLFLHGSISSNPNCFTKRVVKSVQLPNGQLYQFKYNEYGELARVTLPTGGGFRYVYKGSFLAGASITGGSDNVNIHRHVAERREFLPGDQVTRKQTFASSDPFVGDTQMTVHDYEGDEVQLLSKVVHYFRGPKLKQTDQSPVSYAGKEDGREYRTEFFRTAGSNLLRRVSHFYVQREPVSWWTPQQIQQSVEPPNDLRLVQTTTELLDGGAMTSVVTFGYDEYNNETERSEYDFNVLSTPRRRINREYLKTNRLLDYVTLSEYNVQDDARLLKVRHIRDLPLRASVFDGACEVARTTYEYDMYGQPGNDGLTARSNATGRLPQADAQAYSTDPIDATFIPRGNVTKAARWAAYVEGATACMATGNPVASETRHSYDVLGNVVKRYEPEGQATSFNFADSWNGLGLADLEGLNTYGFATSETNAKGHIEARRFDYGSGKADQITDANGKATLLQFDDNLERLTLVMRPTGGTVRYAYSPDGRTVAITASIDASSTAKVEQIYDGLGRECETRLYENASAVVRVLTQVDGLGRRKRESNPYRVVPSGPCAANGSEQWTTITYDELSRVKAVVSADGSATSTAYAVNVTTMTDAAGIQRSSSVDGLGRLITVVENPNGLPNTQNNAAFTTAYTYDVMDNLLQVAQSGRTRTFSYDSLGRLRKAEQPESGIVRYVYDLNGNLRQKSDARVTATMVYDSLDRVLSKGYSGGTATPGVAYCYDGDTSGLCGGAPTGAGLNLVGRLTMVANGVSEARYGQYDAIGRPLASSQVMTLDGAVKTFPFIYAYNHLGLETMTLPSGRQIKYGFDAAGRVNEVSRQVTGTWTPYARVETFAPHGAIEQMLLANGAMRESWGYNPRLQPSETRLVRTAEPAVNLAQLQYFYCGSQAQQCNTNNGNLVRQRISHSALAGEAALDVAQDFTYDGLNRLWRFAEGSASETNTYDAWGNRWADAEGLPEHALMPKGPEWFGQANNRIWSTTNPVVYDASGNQETYTPYTVAYDGENRPVTVRSSVNGSAAYFYDGEGRRVKKLTCAGDMICADGTSVRTLFVYDAGGKLAAEYGAGGETGTQYLMADHLGSTRVVADGAGTVVRRHDYRPFGENLAGLNGRSSKYADTMNALRFTGKERDGETGLDYFGARYLSAAQGRFTSPDPLLASGKSSNPQTWNRYSYVGNNPLQFVDPTGLDWVASGDANNPYKWVDKCEEGTSCYASVAANVGGNLRVYGSAGDYDVFDVQGRDVSTAFGNGRIVDVSFMFSNPDAHIQDNQNIKENFLSVDGAAALFNTGAYYHSLYPKDEKLGFNGGSLGNGYGAPVHKSHALGLFLDLAYMGPNGKVLRGDGASAAADPGRTGNITSGLISTPGSPFKEFLTLTPGRLGGAPGRAFFYPGHGNHAHYQKRRLLQ